MSALIPTAIYLSVGMCFIGILDIFKIIPYNDKSILSADNHNKGFIKSLLVGFLLIVYIGFRDPYDLGVHLGDTQVYTANYELVQNGILDSEIDSSIGANDKSGEIGFAYIRNYMAKNQYDVNLWYCIIAAIYILPMIFALHRIFPGYEYLAFLFWISSFGFFPWAVNGLRNGNAMSLFICGMALILYRRNYFNLIIGILFCLLSYLFHHSIIILWAAFLGALFLIKTTNKALVIWIFAIITTFFLGNYLANYASSFGLDERADEYLLATQDSMSNQIPRFRWDFLLFSAMPILMGWYVTVKRGIKDRIYQILLNTYILANSVWVVFMYAAFTNRFAALSWALYSIVLTYPLIKYKLYPNNQNTVVGLILIVLWLFSFIFS